MATVGCAPRVIDDVAGRESRPVGEDPLDPMLLTRKMSIWEPPLSGTITKAPSEVIPPGPGAVPVETVAGLTGVSRPVAGEYWNWEIWFDCVSTTYTKFSNGSMMNDVGPSPLAATGEPLTGCSVPSALEQVGVTSMHAEKMETLLDNPEFATKRVSPSDAVQLVFTALPPAHLENANAAGVVPVL